MKKENILAAMMFGGQAGGGGLPSITDDDYGKLLTVFDDGSWGASDLNDFPRYIPFSLSTSDGKTFIVNDHYDSATIYKAIMGGFEVRVEAMWNDDVYFEVTLPPLKIIKTFTMNSYAAYTQGLVVGSALRIVVRNINPDTPQGSVDIIALGYESAIPEKIISLAITDPITYSGTADITQSDISSYIY